MLMKKLSIACVAVLALVFAAPALADVGSPTLSGTATATSGGVS
jgi:hypothetical protein